jgi:hypothetical protein
MRVPAVFAVAIAAALGVVVPAPRVEARREDVVEQSFLDRLNMFRAQSGLAPVAPSAGGTYGAEAHSCWMLSNGLAHDETPGSPGYTPEGDAAGNSSHVAVSTEYGRPDAEFADDLIGGPFHAVGLLHPGLRSVSAGRCDTANTLGSQPWRSAMTVDVRSGLSSGTWTSKPITFPGDGAITPLSSFDRESPDPRDSCGWSGAAVGLPLVAMFARAPGVASASLAGPGGPIEVCVLTEANTTGLAQSILRSHRAVVVVPRQRLADGTHSVSVVAGTQRATWTFAVDTEYELQPVTAITSEPVGFTPIDPVRLADSRKDLGVVRLRGGVAQRLQVGGRLGVPGGATAVAVNLTATESPADGFLTAYPCGAVPTVSALNWTAGMTRPNSQIIPLDATGGMCLYSNVDTDIVVDATGYFSPDSPGRFTPIEPFRAADSRIGEGIPDRIEGGSTVEVQIGGLRGVPVDAAAAVVNLTVVSPSGFGFATAFPCGTTTPPTSTLNFVAGDVRPNNAIVRLGTGGRLCVFSTTSTDLLVDVTGWIGASGLRYQPLVPLRILDTRDPHPLLSAFRVGRSVPGQGTVRRHVAGRRGIPAEAGAVTLNVTAVGHTASGFVTVWPSGSTRPTVSTVNYRPKVVEPNGVHVGVRNGAFDLFSLFGGHLVVDITGVWVAAP